MSLIETEVLQVESYEVSNRKEWDALVEKCKSPLFLFYRDYMDYHADRFEDASVMVYRNGKLIALMPCNNEGEYVVTHGGLTYGGLLYTTDLHAADIVLVLQAVMTHFKALGKTQLLYKAIPRPFFTYPADEDLYALTKLGGRLVRRDLSTVIKQCARLKLSDSRKSTARRAGKAGAYVGEVRDLVSFHKLLSNVLGKFGVKPVHSLEELQLLISRFPDNIIVFGTFLKDELLAASLIFDFGHIVHTQYLASSDEGRKLGALDFLLVDLTQGKYADREFFSFGISTECNGMHLNEGLIRQKEGFGGRGLVHDFYRLDLR